MKTEFHHKFLPSIWINFSRNKYLFCLLLLLINNLYNLAAAAVKPKSLQPKPLQPKPLQLNPISVPVSPFPTAE